MSDEIVASSQDSLLSPDDVKTEEGFREYRKRLSKIVAEAKSIPTPSNQVEEKGGFKYPVYDYMEGVMDELHPLRTIEVTFEYFDPTYVVFMTTVKVTDLVTKEVRPGTGLHPVIIFDAGSDTRKPDNTIRMHFANAKKASLTEAIRDAYAHFGVAADLYGMKPRQQPTPEQKARFERAISVRSDIGKEYMRKKWETQFEDSADNFIESVLQQNEEVRKKQTNKE